MSIYDKKYDAFKIFEEIAASSSQNNNSYYEIEYDSCPLPGVGKFVLKSQKIEAPEKDEIRDLFNRMRDIAREHRFLHYNSSSKFYDRRVQQNNSQIFYEQGMFMKDFEDEYGNLVPYSSYFPYYQMMGYEQLRTYFTWRTQVRRGNVSNTSLSYAFLYIYELLNNIGVDSPQDGLEKLMFFRNAFRVYDSSIDKYVPGWLKDYHIYYELPQSFRDFVEENNLAVHYPKLSDPEDDFELFCSISKYDIRESGFYTGDNINLIKNCFYFTIDKLRLTFTENGINFDESIFQPTKNMSVWTPFKGALFYPWMRQRDRQVVLSEKEIYRCSQNRWTFNTVITTESGKRLIGYVMKQMESVLRKAVRYKYSLSANVNAVNHEAADQLKYMGVSLEKTVTDAVTAFYREATKTIVKIDQGALAKIRREALITQEKLIVPEEDGFPFMTAVLPAPLRDAAPDPLSDSSLHAPLRGAAPAPLADPSLPAPLRDTAPDPLADSWAGLRAALSETEAKALRMALSGDPNIKQFADEHGIMFEVLMDGINGKAMDFIGDSLLDDEFTIYEDYTEQVRNIVLQ